MSSGSPFIQAAKLGEAMMLLSAIASPKRSFSGKKVSRSKTPTCRKGGFCTAMISCAMSRSSPARQAFSRMVESRMCSRLRTGSASMPTRPSSADTVPWMRSRRVSASVSQSSVGALKLLRMLTGSPASEPGV